MKTPREILLKRHQATAPKLDAIRNAIVTEFNHQNTKAQSENFNLAPWCRGGLRKIWFELVWPSRRIWTSLAAIWIFIFIANVSQRDHSQMTMTKSSSLPEMVLSFRQQEKLLAELIGQSEPRVAEVPKTFSPKPSSQRQFEILTT